MELLRRRKKKAEQLRAEAGLSQQDLAAMAEKAESAEGGAPKKLKLALSFKLGGASGAGAGPSRFAPKEETPLTKPTTSRFRATSSRDDVLCQIAEGLASVPAYAAFAVPVTKKALPDYHKFVSRKMDLGTIARAAKRAGGYESVDAWMRDVRQILTNARLYHEADEDVLIRVPAIVHAAEALVRDAETALEARANDIAQFDNAFDLEKVLGRTTNKSEAE
jgi:transcription initiation factor TFIID subunit 1